MRFYVRCCAVVLCLVEPAERADLWLRHQVLEQRKVSVLGADVEGTTASTSLEGRRDHSFDGRFGPLRNRPPVLWCRFPGSRPKRRHSLPQQPRRRPCAFRHSAIGIPGVTEKTANRWRKNEQKWARYSRLKRVRAALLRLRNT